MSGRKSALSLETRWSCLRLAWKELMVCPLHVAKNRRIADVGEVWIFLWSGDNSGLQFAHSKHIFITCKLQRLEQLKGSDVILLVKSTGSICRISIKLSVLYFERVAWWGEQTSVLGIQQLMTCSPCMSGLDMKKHILPCL